MMKVHEPECVALKRRGAEHVAKMVAGMSLQEQLEFWRKRTEAMLVRQESSSRKQSMTQQK
jgi:hypothetical protein